MLQSKANEFSTVTFLITEELSENEGAGGDDSGGGAGTGGDSGGAGAGAVEVVEPQ